MPMVAEVHKLVTTEGYWRCERACSSRSCRGRNASVFTVSIKSCDWSSDGVEDYEIDSVRRGVARKILVAGTESEDSEISASHIDVGTYMSSYLPVFAGGRRKSWTRHTPFPSSRKNAGKSSWFNPSLLKNILEPAVEPDW